ncbi:MAG: hypothetical protein Q7U64_11595 [Desulfocapsaceae bacterium]|nr:hypothetical protein [Desulfocapsaceae bacterium]
MNYKIFLSDLCSSLPEVNGAFLFTPQSGIVAKQLDNLTSNFNPLAIGKKITDIAAIATEQLDDITQIEVNFDAMILAGRLLPNQNWLFLLHNPELSSGMIRMALQMALNNSSHEDDDSQTNQPEAPIEDMVEEVNEDEQPTTQEEEIQFNTEALMAPDAPLAKQLQILQDELANFIGPVAVPVFHEILNTWCQGHTPALDTMKHLIPLMDKEIDDTEDINTFHTNIKDLIPQE